MPYPDKSSLCTYKVDLVVAVMAELNKTHVLRSFISHMQSQNQNGPSFQPPASLPAAQNVIPGLCPPAPQDLPRKAIHGTF